MNTTLIDAPQDAPPAAPRNWPTLSKAELDPSLWLGPAAAVGVEGRAG